MHDPDAVAFEIPGPWVRRWSFKPCESDPRWGIVRRRRTNPENLGQPVYPWWHTGGWRVFAAGAEWRLGRLATIWHHEPGGRDSGEVCKGRWQWHVHHWHIQVPPLQHFRRRTLTRCAWCGGRSRKGDAVNFSHGWDSPKSPRWQGERGLFHEDCSSIESSHRTCTCSLSDGAWESILSGTPYGQCATCGLFRAWRSDRDVDSPREVTTALLKGIPQGQRDPAVSAEVHRLWAEYRATVDKSGAA